MIAVIFAYRRPSLVLANALQTIKLNSEFKIKYGVEIFSEILLAHDGIRSNESLENRKAYEETLATCISLEQEFSEIKFIKFADNIGLTPHAFRIFQLLKSNADKAVVIEEDKSLKFEGLEFLYSNYKLMDSKSLIDTLPRSNHSTMNFTNYSTLHTDGGNLIYGSQLIETAKAIWKSKDKFKSDFENNLMYYLGSFLSGYSLRNAFRYYSNNLSWGLFNPDRPDALFAYTLIMSKQLKICPTSRLSYDWSDKSNLGLNVNHVRGNEIYACDSKPTKIWNFSMCNFCEKKHLSERVAITRLSRIRAHLSYKIGNLSY